MYYDLSDTQRKYRHLPSIYNAALHNKSGWAAIANAIIKYQLPQLLHLHESDGVKEHIQSINAFCRDLLKWLKKFAAAALAYWKSAEYAKARATSKARGESWVVAKPRFTPTDAVLESMRNINANGDNQTVVEAMAKNAAAQNGGSQ